ncbi:NAD-dependent epimerase/dehydratase family protein [Virgisporangium aliadipatigenens]|uniref:NAD-dependent epimerase/dehydratase family protein n=1 Tax=Virgisporangium aliadipatigenens TaxID=741659 RepID=UPI0019459E51|nr:NAD-dependent epimerase/dehydratase family protein [Virgisporangium aliadipatigenens]
MTGVTGFVAGHCVRELLTHGYDVRGTVRDPATADVAHLRAIAAETGRVFDVVRADLTDDAGWAEAVDGCACVWHVASPNPTEVPRDPETLVRPAVDGTLRVLRAAAAAPSVKRVVYTSSVATIRLGHADLTKVRTEADWSVPDGLDPYPRSKVLAERAAWEFAEANGLDLVVVNPGLVLGPLLNAAKPMSLEILRRIFAGEVPAVPRMSFAVTDARDVAVGHRLAMENPDAAGRYILAGPSVWLGEMARVLDEEFAPLGYRVARRPAPRWLLWVVGRWDRDVRMALRYLDQPTLLSSDRAIRELGWTQRPVRESIVDAAESFVRFGTVDRPRP